MDIIRWSDKVKPKLRAINLELTNFCNFKCSFCLNPNSSFRPKGYISQELIDKVYNDLPDDTGISICGIGEPSLHPDFCSILKKLSSKFTNLSIVTNGYLFRNSELIKSVLNSNINKINLSLDYINPVKFKENKDGDLYKVLGFIKDFLTERKNYTEKPLLQINYLYAKEKTDYLDAIEYFKKISSDPWCIYIRKIKDLAGQVGIDEEKDEEYLDVLFKDHIDENVIVENWNRYLSHTNFHTDNPKICRHIYDYYMLLWNGAVVPCCVDFNASMVLCNVLEKKINLMELFYSDIYKRFRNTMERVDYRDYPLCVNCNDYYKA